MRSDTFKNSKSVEEIKVRESERRDRCSQGGTDVKEREKLITGHRIRRVFNHDIEN